MAGVLVVTSLPTSSVCNGNVYVTLMTSEMQSGAIRRQQKKRLVFLNL